MATSGLEFGIIDRFARRPETSAPPSRTDPQSALSYEGYLRVKNGISDSVLMAAGLPPARDLSYEAYLAAFGGKSQPAQSEQPASGPAASRLLAIGIAKADGALQEAADRSISAAQRGAAAIATLAVRAVAELAQPGRHRQVLAVGIGAATLVGALLIATIYDGQSSPPVTAVQPAMAQVIAPAQPPAAQPPTTMPLPESVASDTDDLPPIPIAVALTPGSDTQAALPASLLAAPPMDPLPALSADFITPSQSEIPEGPAALAATKADSMQISADLKDQEKPATLPAISVATVDPAVELLPVIKPSARASDPAKANGTAAKPAPTGAQKSAATSTAKAPKPVTRKQSILPSFLEDLFDDLGQMTTSANGPGKSRFPGSGDPDKKGYGSND